MRQMKGQRFFGLIILTMLSRFGHGQAPPELNVAMNSPFYVSTNWNKSFSMRIEEPDVEFDNQIFKRIATANSTKSYERKSKFFVALTIPLVTGSLVAGQAKKKDLALGLAGA